jgi:hypothetical protein
MEFIEDILYSITKWWVTLETWWKYLKDWLSSLSSWVDSFFSDLNTIFDSWGVADYFNDFILSWGDWIVGWAKVIVVGIASYLSGVLLWRIMTYFLSQAVVNQASFYLKTGLAGFLITWFWHTTLKSLGLGIVGIGVQYSQVIPRFEAAMISGINKIPVVFHPMIDYFAIPDAIHFIFSVFVIILTFKAATWVLKPPLL